MPYRLITAPLIEPVSLDEAKAYLRIGHDTEDLLIGMLIASARALVEASTGRALLSQGWEAIISLKDGQRHVLLPRAPLQSVSSVERLDADGVAETIDAERYVVLTDAEPGEISLLDGVCFGSRVRVRFSAGYGNAASDVPDGLRLAVLHIAAFWYEHRGDEAGLRTPESFAEMVAPFKILRIGAACM